MDLLDTIIAAGWDAYVRRSPATTARPAGKVLRWGVNTPDGTKLEHRTGPGLVGLLHGWCSEHWPAGMEADSPVPTVTGYYATHQPPSATDGAPPATRGRVYTGRLLEASTQRQPVQYAPDQAFPEHAEHLRKLATLAYQYGLTSDQARRAELSNAISALVAKLYLADLPLQAIAKPLGVAHSSVKNRARTWLRRNGVQDTRTGRRSGPRPHARRAA